MNRTVLALALLCSGAVEADEITLAVTTSFHNSGLSDVLLPEIKADLDLDVQLLVVGTGQALRLGTAGDVDALLVHSKAAELAFIESGAGTHRREIMYNDFVVVGPDHDPAMAGATTNVVAAFSAIQEAEALFVSRGDDSGTHKRELSIWAKHEADPESFDARWYREVGAGMGASLNTASAMNAYILSDRASWLKFGNKGTLDIVFEGDPMLVNQYAFLPVNPERFPHVQAQAAERLEAWLISDRARDLIDGYRLNDTALFTFNAGQTADE